MTDNQFEQCEARLRALRDAGITAELREFRSVSGYRIFATDHASRRYTRDGQDPVALVDEMIRVFNLDPVESVITPSPTAEDSEGQAPGEASSE